MERTEDVELRLAGCSFRVNHPYLEWSNPRVGRVVTVPPSTPLAQPLALYNFLLGLLCFREDQVGFHVWALQVLASHVVHSTRARRGLHSPAQVASMLYFPN